MRIHNLTIKEEVIVYAYSVNDGTDSESKMTIECPEAPKPELKEKFALLGPIACRVMGWPPSYAIGMNVYRLALRYTKHGTRSVQFKLEKSVELVGGKPHKLVTPWARIDKPEDGESGSVELTDSEVATIEEAVFEITEYVGGNRGQGLLGLDEARSGINALAEKGRKKDDNQPELEV